MGVLGRGPTQQLAPAHLYPLGHLRLSWWGPLYPSHERSAEYVTNTPARVVNMVAASQNFSKFL